MERIKEKVGDLVKRLPEDATWDDLGHEILERRPPTRTATTGVTAINSETESQRMSTSWLPNVLRLFLGLASLGILVPETPAQAPERVILFHIDALHPDAPRRLGLRNILQLAEQGTSVAEAITITPWHATTGPYGKTHTTSLPNPVTLAGTLFLRPGQKMLQHCFYPGQLTAHVAHSTAYESLNPGLHYVALDRTNTDADLVRLALDFLRNAFAQCRAR